MKKYTIVTFVITIIVFIAFIIVKTLFFNDFEATSLTKTETLEILNNTESFRIVKNYSKVFSNAYYVVIDKKIIATVEGETLPIFGDVFTLRSSNGELICYEKEEILHLNNQATVYNENDEEIGRIEEEYLHLLYVSNYYIADKKIATCKQSLGLTRQDIITDTSNNILYEIKGDFLNRGYDISVKNTSIISPEIAIFFGCINDAIENAKNNN